MIIALLAITSGIALIWVSAEKLENYSVHAAREFGFSPFFIGCLLYTSDAADE